MQCKCWIMLPQCNNWKFSRVCVEIERNWMKKKSYFKSCLKLLSYFIVCSESSHFSFRGLCVSYFTALAFCSTTVWRTEQNRMEKSNIGSTHSRTQRRKTPFTFYLNRHQSLGLKQSIFTRGLKIIFGGGGRKSKGKIVLLSFYRKFSLQGMNGKKRPLWV